MKRATSLFLFALTLVVVGACNEEPAPTAADAAPPKTSPKPLALGIAIPSYVHAIAWIAEDRGAFDDAGLDTTVTVTGGSAAALRTLIAKQNDVVLAGGDAVLKANHAGADVVVVAAFVNRFYHRIVAKKELETPDDLKGKTIGLPFLGGPQDMTVKWALDKHDLAYGEDVKVLGLGKELNRVAALKHGEIDATTSQTPPARLDELGLHVLVDPSKADVPFPYMVMAVRRDELAERRADIVAALGALCEAATFYRAANNRTASLAIIAKHIAGSDTVGAREARYDHTGPSFLSWPPTPSRDAFETVARLSGGKVTLSKDSKVVDDSLLKDLQSKGRCKP
jgi:NitT/TauT family transport system substrate-binding protein